MRLTRIEGHHMHPVLFVIPLPFTETKILIYSVFFSITVALVLGIYLGTRAAQNEGLPVETALNMTFFGLIGVVLGARLYAFFENPSFYFNHPLRLIKLWEGSLGTYGGAIGGVLGSLGYLVLKRQPLSAYFDVYAPYAFLGIGIIRIGDFLNGTAFGKTTGLPWGISFPKGSFAYNRHLGHGWIGPDAASSMPVHPTQLYSAISCFLIFFLLLSLASRLKKSPGSPFLLGAGLYAGSRFLVDFLRDDLQRHSPWNLASTQWVGITVLGSLLLAWYCLNLAHKRRAATNGAITGE
jgi:phosphatidylglycerol:prolipoprotein diacylglycerol transferase